VTDSEVKKQADMASGSVAVVDKSLNVCDEPWPVFDMTGFHGTATFNEGTIRVIFHIRVLSFHAKVTKRSVTKIRRVATTSGSRGEYFLRR
jgi:hypothetical protein